LGYITSLDIKIPFLEREVEEEFYIKLPLDFMEFGFVCELQCSLYGLKPLVAQGEFGLVCKLRHSLYGLKQSLRAWFGKFSCIVQSLGLKHSEAN